MPTLKTILHVDDEPDLRELVAMSLELGGLAVHSCASGQEAIKAIQTVSPDLIILDVMMPGLDGPATLKALRAEPNGQAPVIFMTAKGMQSEITRLRQLGAVEVVAKPFDPVTLSDSIRAIWQTAAGSRSEQKTSDPEPPRDDTAAAMAALQNRFRQRLRDMHELLGRIEGGQRTADSLLTLRDCAHKLAGSAGTFGYPEVSALASGLERAAEEAMEGRADSLASAHAALRNKLADLIASPNTGI